MTVEGRPDNSNYGKITIVNGVLFGITYNVEFYNGGSEENVPKSRLTVSVLYLQLLKRNCCLFLLFVCVCLCVFVFSLLNFVFHNVLLMNLPFVCDLFV